MSFSLREQDIRRLCQLNRFPAPSTGMIFFGLRGSIPVHFDAHPFAEEQEVEIVQADSVHPRCILGQWLPEDGTIAVFPGSTIPHRKYIATSIENDGKGTNQLMTGYYRDYRKGIHKQGSPKAHPAFRQTEGHPVRRTADDFDFDNDDRVEFMNPYDNIHAGWCMGINQNDYASAGCQVLVGFPACDARPGQSDSGPWRAFKENAYSMDQSAFPYLLLTGFDAQRVRLAGSGKISPRLRFGSEGNLVSLVQDSLRSKGFYEGIVDGAFGTRTARALLEYQASVFGPSADDGIVGPVTAQSLGLTWPEG